MTLSGSQGLPGYKAQKGSVASLKTFKSSIIRPGKAIDGFRFTVVATEYPGEKANEHQFFYLSEFSIYDKAGNKLNYTATSNACHNTLTGGTDGGGLNALKDGEYTTYFHSVWDGSVAPAADHYIEFTLDAPVEEFVVEWNARNTKQYMPTIVGLTEKGKDFVAFSDVTYALGEKINTLNALTSAAYVTIQGHAAETYTIYDNNNPGQPSVSNDVPQVGLEGSGSMFTAGNGNMSKDATISQVAQLVPTGEGDTYYVFFPVTKTYFSADASGNSFNDALNGNQNTTSDKNKAAKVTLTAAADGKFTMHYTLEKNEAQYTVYIGADPRGQLKILAASLKDANEAQGYCTGFGIGLAFNFSFYNTEYTAPTWDGEFLLGYNYFYAQAIYDIYGNEIFEDEDGLNAEALAAFEEALPAAWETVCANENKEYDYYVEASDDLREALGRYVEALVNTAYETVGAEAKAQYENRLSATPKNDYYPEAAYNTYIINNIITAGRNLYNRGEDENPIDYIDELFAYLNSVQTNIDQFLATKYIISSLPIVYGEADSKTMQGSALTTGKVDGRLAWEKEVNLVSKVDGIRVTFLANTDSQKYNGFPMISLSEFDILVNGQELALDETLVTSNCIASNDGGGIAALFDNNTGTYYHSTWGSGTHDPVSYVYLDVKFPEGVSTDNFTIKFVARRSNGDIYPAQIALTEDGVALDPKLMAENPYNVVMGEKITDPSQLVDGGIYLLSGNLRVNLDKNASAPRFYSGTAPYHNNPQAAANDPCVYMFKKVGEGWNIISLANAQYWSNEAGMTTIQSEAAVVKFALSNNIPDAMVIYRELEDNFVDASWTYAAEGEDSITVETAQVNANRFVYMDWDSSLAGRACVSELPGVFEHGLEAINAHEKAADIIKGSGYSAGDYLHFNKANGEGEWNIHKVTMDTPYYRWLVALVGKVGELAVVPGIDPGCVIADAEVEAAFNEAKAAADAAVAAEEKDNAQALVEALVAAVNSVNGLDQVGINPEAYYSIQSAYPDYFTKQGVTKSIYVDAETQTLKWTTTPEVITPDKGEFAFRFIFLDEDKQLEFDTYPTADEADYAYLIYNEATETYFSGVDAQSTNIPVTGNSAAAVVYVVKSVLGNQFTISQTGNQSNDLHTAGHGNGASGSGNIVYWNGGANGCSAWNLRTIDVEATSVSDLVVEGDEVVSVCYFTPAGAATATPAKGINVVVVVYANGVIETKKVLVK